MLRRLSFAALLLLWVQIHLEAAQSGSVQVLVDGKTISAPIIRRGDQASITLSTSFANGSIYYTVDGSEPSVSSTRYSSPFVVRSTSTVKAIAYSLDFSETAFANPVTIQMVGYVNFHYRGGPGILNLDPQPARHDPSDPDHPYPQYVTGTVVRMSFTPAPGWILMRWVMNDAETNTAPTIDIVMTNDTWVEIAVGTRATIVQSDHGRIESPYLGTNLVQYQNGLGLKAVPDPGYYLAAWGGRRDRQCN